LEKRPEQVLPGSDGPNNVCTYELMNKEKNICKVYTFNKNNQTYKKDPVSKVKSGVMAYTCGPSFPRGGGRRITI
jgi:hypothetical protein